MNYKQWIDTSEEKWRNMLENYNHFKELQKAYVMENYKTTTAFEEWVKAATREFLARESTETSIYVYPDEISGIPEGKVVEVTFRFRSEAAVNNKPE